MVSPLSIPISFEANSVLFVPFLHHGFFLLSNLSIFDACKEQTSEDDHHVDEQHNDNEDDEGDAEDRVLGISDEVDRVQAAQEHSHLVKLLQSK